MRTATGKISKFNVTIIAIEAGEKPRQVREAAGIGIDDEYTLSIRGDDFENGDDLRSNFPETAALMESNGIDLDTLRGYIEVINQ